MSPEKVIKINGARPSLLRISKESHTIHKPSDQHHHHQQKVKQRQQPVIIYTHSPKIIHIHPREFMPLVQKLTGMSRENNTSSEVKSDTDESSLVPTTEINSGNNGSNRNSSIVNPSFADIPLFTPSASTDFNFFCSPRPAFRLPDASALSPNLGSPSLSPSFLEFMKGLPEY
ncbi:hypothetical protein TIFTF001_007804 [Ficus carica]|uniref:VQ domain-containing protein n=1 Tax=Ficus carica TaxID=3494 RepID=A0AA88A7C5_FICCA|nr:hypothetical protein TIFTF001_007804 [Ficus carica]